MTDKKAIEERKALLMKTLRVAHFEARECVSHRRVAAVEASLSSCFCESPVADPAGTDPPIAGRLTQIADCIQSARLAVPMGGSRCLGFPRCEFLHTGSRNPPPHCCRDLTKLHRPA